LLSFAWSNGATRWYESCSQKKTVLVTNVQLVKLP
jgi:hypothetical protein